MSRSNSNDLNNTSDTNADVIQNNTIHDNRPQSGTYTDGQHNSDFDQAKVVTQFNENLVQIEQDEREPTADELATLKRVADKIPLAAWLIVLCELCERFAFYGLSGLFQNYIEFPPHNSSNAQPGALDMGRATATALTNFFRFFAYITPILGAVLADQYWGKYKTIVVSCAVYMLGLLIVLFTSIPPSMNAGVAFPGIIVGMVVLGFGTGGVKSNVSPLMAEQYTRTKPVVKVIRGEKKIVDPEVTMQSMFNWFYWAINIGALSLIATTNIEKYHSFWLAYLVPTVVFLGTVIVLVIGRKIYVQKPPGGSLLVRAMRVITTAISKRWNLGTGKRLESIFDYAKETPSSNDLTEQEIAAINDHNKFVDDLKQAVNACRVFLFYPFYWICYNQFGSNLVSQAAQMNVGPLPNDLLQNIDPIVLVIFIPIFDKLIYPCLRHLKINFSAIPRIVCGFFFVALGMGWSALVQHLIYVNEPRFKIPKGCEKVPNCNTITVAWQIPAYFFIALSEIFASVTGFEYAFSQAPASMKSIVMSLFLFTSAISSAIGLALVPVYDDPKILWMYASLAIQVTFFGILLFILFRNKGKVQPA